MSRCPGFRILCLVLACLVALQAAHPPAAAEEDDVGRREALERARARILEDQALLEARGKEAYLEDLDRRIDRDGEILATMVEQAAVDLGPRRLGRAMLGLEAPPLTEAVEAAARPWTARALAWAVRRFLKRAGAALKARLRRTDTGTLVSGLAAQASLFAATPEALARPTSVEEEALDPSAAASRGSLESFFENTTAVRNLVVALVAVVSLVVAVVLAFLGSSAAPVVAVIGALVGLLRLLSTTARAATRSEAPEAGAALLGARPSLD